MIKILISILAINQTKFGKNITTSKNNRNIEFISFDEKSNKLLEKTSTKYLNVHHEIKSIKLKDDLYFNKFHHHHEKIAYNNFNSNELIQKYKCITNVFTIF